MEALEAAAESAPAEDAAGFEVDDSNDQAFTLFDEHGALIDADVAPDVDASADVATSTRGFRREPHDGRDRLVVEPDDFRDDDDAAAVAGTGGQHTQASEMDPIALASAAVKASRARSMYDDVRRFFRRDRGRIDRADWERYMRHRAKTHADSVQLCPHQPLHTRELLSRAEAPGQRTARQAPRRARPQVPPPPQAVRVAAAGFRPREQVSLF